MKVLKFLAIVALCVSMASCTKKQLELLNEKPGKTEIELKSGIRSLTISLNPKETKVALGEGTKLVWEVGDMISMNGIVSDPLTEGGKTAVFTFTNEVTPDANNKYTVVYPSNADGLSYTDGAYSFSISRSNVSKTEKFVMAGSGVVEDGVANFGLKHIVSFIKVTPAASSDNIRRIYIHGYDQMIAGTFSIDCSGEAPTLTPVSDNYRYAFMDCTKGELTLAPGESYVLAVPAATYSNGIYVKMVGYDNLCSIAPIKQSGSYVAKGGKILTLANSGNELIFNPATEPYELASQAEYDILEYVFNENKSWALDWMGTKEGVANTTYLNADITATKPLVKAVYVDSVLDEEKSTFDYVLEGNPAKTFTYNNASPLIHILGETGTIKSLNMETNVDAYKEYTAPLVHTNKGLISDVSNTVNIAFTAVEHLYCSGLVIANGGSISDCTVNGAIAITVGNLSSAAENKAMTVAGIACAACDEANQAGHITISGDFTNCVNNADLTVLNTNALSTWNISRNVPVAGICAMVFYGNSEEYSTFDGCVNNGKITHTESLMKKNCAYAMGGIVGRVAKHNNAALDNETGFYAVFNNCTNTGTITQAGQTSQGFALSQSGAKLSYAGGIIGAALGKDTNHITLTDCHNEASICGGFNYDEQASATVLGGLLGLASYVDIIDSDAKTTITDSPLSDAKVSAIGGLIGFVLRESSVVNCKAYLEINAPNTKIHGFGSGTDYFVGLACAGISSNETYSGVNTAAFTNCQFGGKVTAIKAGPAVGSFTTLSYSTVTESGCSYDLDPSSI